MKSLVKKHIKALELRKLGWSYSQIKSELGIAKSTASVWLRSYPLTHEQLDKLQFHSDKRIEHFRETMAKKKRQAFELAMNRQKTFIEKLSSRELYLCGLALYWGEGGKTKYSELTFANTDPRMIRFFLIWITKCLEFPEEKLKIRLHLYKDMNIEDEIKYWMSELSVGKNLFVKPYIKQTTLRGLTYKGRGHGTCNVIASGLTYARTALAGMEVLAGIY